MKKISTLLLSLVLAMALCLCAYAEAVDYTGDWTCTGVGAAGQTLDPSMLGLTMTMVLNADGTCTMNTAGIEETGTWVTTDTGVSMTDTAGDVMDMVYDAAADSLSAEQDGLTVIFTRTIAGVDVRANVPLADFADTWTFEHVEISDGQYFLPEDLGIDYVLTITEEGGSITVSDEEGSDTYPVAHELTEEEELGTVLYTLILNPENTEEYIEVMPLLLFEDDQLVWYLYEEENQLEVFYCFARAAAEQAE